MIKANKINYYITLIIDLHYFNVLSYVIKCKREEIRSSWGARVHVNEYTNVNLTKLILVVPYSRIASLLFITSKIIYFTLITHYSMTTCKLTPKLLFKMRLISLKNNSEVDIDVWNISINTNLLTRLN